MDLLIVVHVQFVLVTVVRHFEVDAGINDIRRKQRLPILKSLAEPHDVNIIGERIEGQLIVDVVGDRVLGGLHPIGLSVVQDPAHAILHLVCRARGN